MAGARWLPVLLALALLGPCLPVRLCAQAPGGLSGKLTDLHSHPLAGATVVARNQATGAESRTVTARNGSYRFAELPPGQYSLAAIAPELGMGRLEAIAILPGYESHLQTSMSFAPLPPPQSAAPLLARLGKLAAAPRIEPALLDLPLPPSSDRAASLPLVARPAPAPLPPLPALQTQMITATMPTAEVLPMALPGRMLIPPRPLQTATTILEARIGQLDLPVFALPLTARELPPGDEVIVATPPAAVAEPLHAAAVVPVRLGTGAAATPAVRMVNQLWGGAMGFAAGVAAISTLRPAMMALSTEILEPEAGDPATALATSTLNAQQLQELPTANRRWQEFMPQSTLEQPPVPIEGEDLPRGSSLPREATTIDGVSRQLAYGATGNGETATVSEAAIAETRFQEEGSDAAGLNGATTSTAIETRQGTEKLHGQLFLFTRQNLWGAQNPFSFWVKKTAPATAATVPTFTAQPYTPPDRDLSWGFGLGGRIRSRRLFWFAAFDNSLRDNPGMATLRHPDLFFAQPTNDQMQVLSARLGLGGNDPVTVGLTQYSRMLETMAGLLGPAPRHSIAMTGFVRLDWLSGERHRLSAEISQEMRRAPGGGWSRVVAPYGNHSFGDSRTSSQWLLFRWQSYLTPNLLAVTQASMGRTRQSTLPGEPSAYESQLLASAWKQLPQIVVDSRYGFTIGNPASFGPGSHPDESQLEVAEQVEWAHRGLLVKAGVQLSHHHDTQAFLRNQTGSYHYSTLLNFVSDALAFERFGIAGQLKPGDQHNCDQTGRVWRDATGQLRGLGYLPCYSYYTQTMGPVDWWLNTNNWTGYALAQWQPAKTLVLSAGMRWQRELMPPAIERLRNPELPLTMAMPSTGNEWAPRMSLAWGSRESHWPVVRAGYGLYYGRTQNATLMTALTHTGSTAGDLDFFLRPTDNLNSGGAPPFPYVLAGQPIKTIKPGAVEFAPGFRNGEVHQAQVGLEESLPGHFRLTATAMLSLGRRLPITQDVNYDASVNPGTITYDVVDPAGLGPIKNTKLTVPFYASWPSPTGAKGRANQNYQQIVQIQSRANSIYEAASLRLDRTPQRGLSLHLRYTYAHAMDWNPNESTQVTGTDMLDPAHFEQEYGTSDLDVRHTVSGTLVWQPRWRLEGTVVRLANGWRLSSIGQFHSGLPYTMRTSSGLVKEFSAGAGTPIVALAPGMNGSGGDNRVYGVGRNTYRYPATWKVDLRLARRFNFGGMRQLELLAESFNLFNHRNVTRIATVGYWIESGTTSGGPPRLNYMNGATTGSTAFGQPLDVNATNYFRERQIQFGLRFRF